MKAKIPVVLAIAAGLLMISGSALAHHSNALVDKDRLITVTGTVTKFAFINPHVGVYFDVKDPQGKVANYYAGGGSPAELSREAGWSVKTFVPGEQILVQGHMSRDGRPLMLFLTMYRCTGETIPMNNSKTQAAESGEDYLTHVKIPKLEAAKVQAICSGKEQYPVILSDLLNNKK
jgi:Family of unknown function (DUF6152)